MFSRIRVQPTTLLRLVQNVRYPITSHTQTLTTTFGVRQNHTPDSYSKEVDHTPPSDDKIHRVDPESDLVQKPYEAPSGWSRAGVQTEKFRNVSGEKQQDSATAHKGGESWSL